MFGLQETVVVLVSCVAVLMLYVIGGGILYWQVIQLNKESGGFSPWWRIILFTLLCGPAAWMILVAAYIKYLSRRRRRNRWYDLKLKILDWLKNR